MSSLLEAGDSTATTPSADGRQSHLPPQDLLIEALLAPSDEEFDAWETGTVKYLDRCMVGKGFPPTYNAKRSEDRAALWTTRVNLMYFDDLEFVRTHGYAPQWASTTDTRIVITEALSHAAETCSAHVSAVYTELSAGLDFDPGSIAAELNGREIVPRLNVDAAYLPVKEQYEACIVEAGYPELLTGKGVTSDASTLADFKCRNSTGFSSALIAATVRVLQGWAESNAGLIRQVDDFNKRLGEAGVALSVEVPS